MDLLRHIMSNLEDGKLKEFTNELIPFYSKCHYNLITILNKKEMEELVLLHPERKTLKYRF